MGGAGACFLFVCLLACFEAAAQFVDGGEGGGGERGRGRGRGRGAWGRVLVKHRDDVLVTGTAQ